MNRLHRLMCLVPLAVACVAATAGCAAAQQWANDTSGSPEVIARIQREYARTEAEAPGYRATEHALDGFSLEGGELHAFYRGSELRKLAVIHFGEMGRVAYTYYFAGDRPVFIHAVREEYVQPLGEVKATFEDRMYYDGDQLIRHVRSGYPEDAEEAADLGPHPGELLLDARRFAACAAAPPGQDAPECTAPAPAPAP